MIHKSTFEELLNRNFCVSIDFQKLGMDISKFVKGLDPEITNEIFQIYWKGNVITSYDQKHHYTPRLFYQSLMAQRV